MRSSSPAANHGGSPASVEERGPGFSPSELTWPTWLFVVAAALVVLLRLASAAGEPTAMVAAASFPTAILFGLVALLPAALLLRVPEAPRTHRLLFAGLAGEALGRWVFVSLPLLPVGQGASPWFSIASFAALNVLQLGAGVCVGLGLLRLRARPTRAWLLIVIMAIDLAFMSAQLVLSATRAHLVVSPALALLDLIPIAGALAGAFGVWVSISAWLDGDAPRPFWGLLALGFPLGLLADGISLAQTVALLAPGPEGLASDTAFLVATAAGALVGTIGTLLALVAYARWTPPSRAARSWP